MSDGSIRRLRQEFEGVHHLEERTCRSDMSHGEENYTFGHLCFYEARGRTTGSATGIAGGG